MKYGFLIPVYNHGASAYNEVQTLLGYGLPIILVDDASGAETRTRLSECAGLSSLVHLVTHEKNWGKGGAVISGFRKAAELGLSHVLQIDADGQHDITRVPRFLELSKANPDAVIAGWPEYDGTVPKSRENGRRIANFFTHLVTMNKKAVRDAMCGFRVYPVEDAFKITSRGCWDARMGFDIEILVRLYWKGVRVVSESVKVTYPEGSTSNFHLVADNIRITWVFIRLCVGTLFHIPSLLKMRKWYR